MLAHELAQSSHCCTQAPFLPVMNRHTPRIDNQDVPLRVVRGGCALKRSYGQARVFRRAGHYFQIDTDRFGYRLQPGRRWEQDPVSRQPGVQMQHSLLRQAVEARQTI
jgi:hypothetical protein